MSVDAGEVRWLKEGRSVVASVDAVLAARWGSGAIETEILSPLAYAAGAEAEAARQAAFLAAPIAIERHDVPGLLVGLVGTVQAVVADALGYGAGLDVFVIGAEESERAERTTLTVLRRLV